MREAEIQNLGCSIGSRNISNVRYANDTALIAQSPMEMQQLGETGASSPLFQSTASSLSIKIDT